MEGSGSKANFIWGRMVPNLLSQYLDMFIKLILARSIGLCRLWFYIIFPIIPLYSNMCLLMGYIYIYIYIIGSLFNLVWLGLVYFIIWLAHIDSPYGWYHGWKGMLIDKDWLTYMSYLL